jgi:glycine betaine/choline ABC-type transport system substrate-binding protein
MRKLLFVLMLVVASCNHRDTKIIVGSKNFSEQVLLGEIISQHIENKTKLKVQRKLNLGGSFICHKALVAGEIDTYVEYTGTALTAILKKEPQNDPSTVFKIVHDKYLTQFNLEWLNPLGFDNTFAILIRGEDARELGVKTISEAARYAPQWIAGFGYEFIERKDGYPGMAALYGLKFKEPPRVMDLTLSYKALANKQIDFAAGDVTNGVIAKLDLFVLEDDRHYFPPYEAAPVVRSAVLVEHSELRDVLNELGGKISADEMRRLNAQVDVDHRDVKHVATEFLTAMAQRKK